MPSWRRYPVPSFNLLFFCLLTLLTRGLLVFTFVSSSSIQACTVFGITTQLKLAQLTPFHEILLRETGSAFLRCEGAHDEDEVEITGATEAHHLGRAHQTHLQHRAALHLRTLQVTCHLEGLPGSHSYITEKQAAN